jgi:hypothetical protein
MWLKLGLFGSYIICNTSVLLMIYKCHTTHGYLPIMSYLTGSVSTLLTVYLTKKIFTHENAYQDLTGVSYRQFSDLPYGEQSILTFDDNHTEQSENTPLEYITRTSRSTWV